ncbi:MAG: hypothetical protein ACKN9D_14400 [Actinomycetales bacterium]
MLSEGFPAFVPRLAFFDQLNTLQPGIDINDAAALRVVIDEGHSGAE